jgi:ADP-heptose:LPS heptosyltransferase/GT2 family glycosyltransferase
VTSPSTGPPLHVAIIALDTLGDLVLRQPLFSELLDRGHAVTAIARTGYDEILPFLDARLRVIPVALDPYRLPEADTYAELDRAAASLTAARPDIVVAAAHNRTYVEEWLLHQCPRAETVGFALPGAVLDNVPEDLRPGGTRRDVLLTRPVDCAESDHEAAKQRALFAAITGESMPERLPAIALDDETRRGAADFVRTLGLEPGGYAFACPAGTMSVALKAWPAAQFAEIAAAVWARHRLPMLLTGVASEAPLVDAIAAVLTPAAVPFGRWIGDAASLGRMLGLIANSRLYVGNDSGPMHCAGALGVPVLARFGGGHWPRFLPLAARAFTATQELPCFNCGWQCWLDTPSCMTSVPAATFVEGIDWLLSSDGAERRIDRGTPMEPAIHSVFTAAMQTATRLKRELDATRTPGLAPRDPIRIAPRPSTRRPKVFIVTPSFNQGRYLRETIDSVLGQDYPNLDYFVADGGSTDDSVEILRSYGERVRWTSGPDGGQAAAIARAWAASDAEIVAWLNSDDTYLDGAVTAAVDHLLAHPEAAMVYGQAWYTNAAGRQMRPYPTRSFDRKNLAAECFICQPAVFLRREVFQVVDLPDPSLRYCMDYDLWIRVAQHFEITSLEQFLATSRLHADNKTIGERGGAIREAVQVSRRHFGAVHPNWALMYTQHQLSTTASRLRIPLETPRRRLLDHLASMYGNRIEAGPYEDGWAGPRTRVEVEGKAGDYVRAVIDFPVWPYAGVLRITAEHEGRILDVRHVRGPSTITLGFRLPESTSPRITVLLGANRAFVPRHHYDWLADSRIISFRLRDVRVDPSLAPQDLRRSARVSRISGALGFLPAFARRLLVGATARIFQPAAEAQLDEHGWVGKRAEVTVVPDDRGRVALECECPAWPYAEPLQITVTQDGTVLTVLTARVGVFRLEFDVARRNAGPVNVVVTANRTYSPRDHGMSEDWRPVSFRVMSGHATGARPETGATTLALGSATGR